MPGSLMCSHHTTIIIRSYLLQRMETDLNSTYSQEFTCGQAAKPASWIAMEEVTRVEFWTTTGWDPVLNCCCRKDFSQRQVSSLSHSQSPTASLLHSY